MPNTKQQWQLIEQATAGKDTDLVRPPRWYERGWRWLLGLPTLAERKRGLLLSRHLWKP